MNTVERIKSICKERKIPISKLEKECKFSNGYIGQLKKGSMPDDKLIRVADYFNVSIDYLITGKDLSRVVETANIDIELTNMEEKMKLYALKMANLSKENQELLMQMIDKLN